MSNFLLTILRFSRWFVTHVFHHYLLMRTYPKYHNGGTNEKFCLILMLQKKPKRLLSHAKKSPSNHNDIYFNNMPLNRENTQKHLGLYLDTKLNFPEHKINEKIEKTIKGNSVIKTLNVTLPRSSY